MGMIDGYKLSGLIQMYEASGEEHYRIEAMKQIDESMAEMETGIVTTAGAYLFAFAQTGLERYKKAAETVFHRLEEQGEDRDLRLMPFYAAYDTAYGNKAHYAEITNLFEQRTGWSGSDLTVLIDTIGMMSMEVYEYYRALCDLYKRVLHSEAGIGAISGGRLFDSEHGAELGYSILKACNLGIIQSEKYGEVGAEIRNQVKTMETGIGMMLNAQYLIFHTGRN